MTCQDATQPSIRFVAEWKGILSLCDPAILAGPPCDETDTISGGNGVDVLAGSSGDGDATSDSIVGDPAEIDELFQFDPPPAWA